MVVGDEVAVRAHEHAGADALALGRAAEAARGAAAAEEVLEGRPLERVLPAHLRVGLGGELGGADLDDGRVHGLGHVGERLAEGHRRLELGAHRDGLLGVGVLPEAAVEEVGGGGDEEDAGQERRHRDEADGEGSGSARVHSGRVVCWRGRGYAAGAPPCPIGMPV